MSKSLSDISPWRMAVVLRPATVRQGLAFSHPGRELGCAVPRNDRPGGKNTLLTALKRVGEGPQRPERGKTPTSSFAGSRPGRNIIYGGGGADPLIARMSMVEGKYSA